MYNKSLVIPGIIIFLLIVLSPMIYNASTFGLKEVPKPELKVNKTLAGASDPAGTDFIRKYHRTYLKEGRDKTVREGVRGTNQSLLKCTECHTTRGKFCKECHDYVGVKPNCWTCHYYPEKKNGIIQRPGNNTFLDNGVATSNPGTRRRS